MIADKRVAWLIALGAVACEDPAPIYPDIPDFSNGATGNQGTGDQSSGASTSSGARPGGGGGPNGGGGKGSGGSGNSNPLYAHCDDFRSGEDPPVGKVQCDLDALEDGGALTGDITQDRTLKSGFSYTMSGTVRVLPGKTLTIEPCVKIMGVDSEATLVVTSSTVGDPSKSCTFTGGRPTTPGRIMAVGEPMAPIVFTSSKPKGERSPGDWGGVLILGNAQHAAATATSRILAEGLVDSECYGWHTTEFNNESSGALEYVRIEYASRQVDMAVETNALTLGAVGSGTSVHHVMVSNSNDDCFEWFGGAVNAHHLIALNCDDDMFDADKGYIGQVQFLFGRQFIATRESDSRGFEIDTGEEAFSTTTRMSNFTVCGGGVDDMNTSREGLVFRNRAAASLTNGVITGFAGGAIEVLDGVPATLTHTQAFGQTYTLGNEHEAGGDWFSAQDGNSSEDPDRFCDCWSDPPSPVAASRMEGGKPTGFADEGASYKGAFEDGDPESNWMRGLWVDWSAR